MNMFGLHIKLTWLTSVFQENSDLGDDEIEFFRLIEYNRSNLLNSKVLAFFSRSPSTKKIQTDSIKTK